jgi:hypothetical protein
VDAEDSSCYLTEFYTTDAATNLTVDQLILLSLSTFVSLSKDLKITIYETLLELMKRNVDSFSESSENPNGQPPIFTFSDETKDTYQEIFYYLVVYLMKLEENSDKNSSFSSNQQITTTGLVLIDEFLSSPYFSSLFSMGIIPENLLNTLNNYFLKVLENNTFTAVKANSIKYKGVLMNLILKATGLYPSLSSLTTLIVSLINLLSRQENMAVVVSELLAQEMIVTNKQIITIEVFLEINHFILNNNGSGQTNSNGSLSTTTVKNLSVFLESYFKNSARDFSHLLPVILNILSSTTAHQIRSSILQSVGYILVGMQETIVPEQSATSAPNEEGDEKEKELKQLKNDDLIVTREKLFDLLFERIYDVNPYTRSALMKCFTSLVEKHVLPLNKFLCLTELVINRLLDKNFLVRKSSIALLTALVENNPFSAILSKEVFIAKLKELSSKEVSTTSSRLSFSAAGNIEGVITSSEGRQTGDETVVQKQFFQSALSFVQIMEGSLEKLACFFDSKNASDVNEALAFFVVAIRFHLSSSMLFYRSAFKLVWHSDVSVVRELMQTFVSVYFIGGSAGGSLPEDSLKPFGSPKEIAYNFMKLISICQATEMISLQEIIARIMNDETNNYAKLLNRREIISNLVYFLEKVSKKIEKENSVNSGNFEKNRRKSSLLLMDNGKDSSHPEVGSNLYETVLDGNSSEYFSLMGASIFGISILLSAKTGAANVTTLISKEEMKKVLQYGLENNLKSATNTDFHAMRSATLVVQQYFRTLDKSSFDSPLFSDAISLITQSMTSFLSNISFDTVGNWFSVCEEAVHTIYKIHPSPELVVEAVIKGIYFRLSEEEFTSTEMLTCFLFVLGQTAVNTVIEIEKIAKLMKSYLLTTKPKQHEEDKKKAKASSKASKATVEDGNIEDFEEQMGISAAIDAEYDQEVYNLTERNLVLNQRNQATAMTNLLGEFLPLLKFIVANDAKQFSNYHLRNVAVLTLLRFMSLSSVVCEENLSLLFTVLSKDEKKEELSNKKKNEYNDEENIQLKTTILVAMGDFAFRFPNVMEPWTNQLYQR